MAIKRILVTGSSGTIGTRLCEKLTEEGYNVVGVDLKHNKWNKNVDKITLIADLRDGRQIDRLPKDFDLVIHLAANARVYNLVVEPSLAMDNFLMLFNMLEFCRRNKVNKFMFASSREVYGNSKKDMHNEEEAYVKNCESPYTASKIGGEALINSYRQCYGINFVITRFSNVYGMYDESDRVVPLFIKLTKQNKDLIVFGKDKYLDFTYIDDTISGLMIIISNFDKIQNDVFNIAYGEGVSILDTAKIIQKELKSKNKIIIKDNRTGEVVRFVADITKAKRMLGFKPKVNITEGVRRSIEWYNKNI